MLVLKVLEIFTLPIILLVFSVISILVWTPQKNEEKCVEKVDKN